MQLRIVGCWWHIQKNSGHFDNESHNRHIEILTDYTTGSTRLEQQGKRTKTWVSDKEEKRDSPTSHF